ncbi:hypothetical protein GCM10025864_44870 [Luteimicrobium album]|uniref:Uncharacterized protein n=1 Tax=Luteimicrobium album TaxID=1054550 RepID=A0ABQ6HW55_9MICO|nr:hypothetical protein [Luteimicrobium album]GMA22261.1 hypothetical protein GCM10025864_00200 [Luteimicrobium album]GMA26666.1 hypothetical protein GCM10025864_44250 [Luteimicrobium album]GMA26728.1 hypothetical protein GCM10025864_44870 [Luteimicrobium album]
MTDTKLPQPFRSGDVRPGNVLAVDGLRGRWSVWSAGPESSTWWLLPIDDAARADVNRNAASILHRSAGAIAVATKSLRNAR